MMTFVAVIHILVALILIALVLVQDSKGGGALGIGGGSNSVLGATGAQSLAAKMTRAAALIFAVTSVALSIMTAQSSKSVIDSAVIPQAAPVAPTESTTTTAAPTTPSSTETTAPAATTTAPAAGAQPSK